MAGIDLAFTGLMILCLEGQTACPNGVHASFPNIAWTLNAKTGTVCGRELFDEASLVFHFKTFDWDLNVDSGSVCNITEIPGETRCYLPKGALCIATDLKKKQIIQPSVQMLPKLESIDSRFLEVRRNRLESSTYVSHSLHFARARIRGSIPWSIQHNPIGSKVEVEWFDSKNGNALGKYSDKLIAHYEDATVLTIHECGQAKPSLELGARAPFVAAFFANETISPTRDECSGYDELPFFLWYYQTAKWSTGDGECPKYSSDYCPAVSLDASVPRCRNPLLAARTCSGSPPADSVLWPPILGQKH